MNGGLRSSGRSKLEEFVCESVERIQAEAGSAGQLEEVSQIMETSDQQTKQKGWDFRVSSLSFFLPFTLSR